MAREGEFAAVRWDDVLCADVVRRLRGLVGQHVYLMPRHVVLAVFHDGEVKSAEFFADFLEVRTIAAVAARVDFALWRDECEAAPKRRVLREKFLCPSRPRE